MGWVEMFSSILNGLAPICFHIVHCTIAYAAAGEELLVIIIMLVLTHPIGCRLTAVTSNEVDCSAPNHART
jgi:hypothetical protein